VRDEDGDDGAVHEAVGAVVSAVELFVTGRPENDTASLPAESCTAALEVAELAAGATYATVMEADDSSADGSVNSTVEPFTTAADGVMRTALAVTVKALAGAVVAWRASLNVRTSFVPFAISSAEESVGAVPSDAGPPTLRRKGYPLFFEGSMFQIVEKSQPEKVA